jgi:prolyl-tRNA synthetase
MMYDRALQMREQMTTPAESYDEMKKILSEKGGFVRAFFTPNPQNEAKIKEETKATVRCIPFEQGQVGKDIFTGEATCVQVLFALAY